MQLSKYLPNLANLSLENNKIRDKKEISMIVPRKDKMIHLRELVLIGNPLREQAYKIGNGATYRGYVFAPFNFKIFNTQWLLVKFHGDSRHSRFWTKSQSLKYHLTLRNHRRPAMFPSRSQMPPLSHSKWVPHLSQV